MQEGGSTLIEGGGKGRGFRDCKKGGSTWKVERIRAKAWGQGRRKAERDREKTLEERGRVRRGID